MSAMEVVDHEPAAWFLLRESDALFLDANCNHGAFGYTFLIRLTADEAREYGRAGREYLSRLARAIQDTAPILEASRSPYKGRDLSRSHGERVTAAVLAWRAGRAPGGVPGGA
ncbi:hypothetical protein tb265_29690 [Gemmatimonadetes bacterium T265]|nr:hypothetical protein tb265_29690 [Gemmatimonadetes bacterium T265]